MDYPKIIIAVLKNFIDNEGTDYLRSSGPEELPGLTMEEAKELARLRDRVRAEDAGAA